ncbi:hypothetical protein HJ588_04435 [Flexivirga sp. ID2601S]|uniref:Uncharacterized protein n=1 Tax=Flexivirga aerilata TaxID=1656889 RepID=A0A849AFB6_9MICO|nr:hypothetical protein [Flexivirga aerilata]NNG38523.1 hypothetical protein [Flexivirga aerilata]
MAMNDADDPLARATAAMKRSEEPVWAGDQRAHVLRRVRSAVTPAELVTTDGAGDHDADGSTTSVSTRVLRRLLREGLPADDSSALDRLTFTVDGGRLTALGLRLVGVYGHDLRRAAETRRERARAILADLLGYDDFPIDVSVADVLGES